MRAAVVLQVLVAATALSTAMAVLTPFTLIDGVANDAATATRVAIDPRVDLAEAGVVVLLLDEKSVNAEPLDAMPRTLMSPVWAALTEKALANGATGVGFDFILAFDGGDLRIGDARPLKNYDTPFLRVLLRETRAGNLFIGRSRDIVPARRFAGIARDRGMAFVDVTADPDGVVRRIHPFFSVAEGNVSPSLSGALLKDGETADIQITPPAPLTDLPAVSVIDVLACDEPSALAGLFNGRAVLVGSGLPGEDRITAPDRFMRRSPVTSGTGPCDFPRPAITAQGADVPGVFVHAAAIDARLSGWALRPASLLTVGLVAALAAALAGLAGLTIAPVLAATTVVALGLIGFAGAAWAQDAGILFPAARPAGAALIGFVAGWAGRLLFLDRRSRALRASFGRYVAPELVDRILAQEKLPELEGEQRYVTIMFADLSGFTALSERVDGKTLTATVNAYLGIIAGEVERSGGYVDKFIGDAVMAMWNAPADHDDHERVAVAAAVGIRDAVAAAAERDRARGLPAFSIKVGVNSGHAIVGNVGSEKRLNYTAVGDAVNIAARMEGLPAVFATPVVVGEACARAAAADFAMLEIASIQVKGRKEPVAVYAPLDEAARLHLPAYAAALQAYRNRAFDKAADGWRALSARDWSGAAIAAVMVDFADLAAEETLDESWAGFLVMKTK
ncbi:CHASE2 domain-containing protein [Oceanibacterium hippocampi]|uniref:Adenylate cyclase 1 n=1 Tax=Oceanibacterium hippocampi TaxID=745714 RepID=A0A1Y5TWX0_9PROT|nr:adenylate/guanylate cyclase domain-containing protein [Oceanibacterium hippocampi]SLN75722.1 Adenylate cyclase 1 [Oceanibacterium hippocampi]